MLVAVCMAPLFSPFCPAIWQLVGWAGQGEEASTGNVCGRFGKCLRAHLTPTVLLSQGRVWSASRSQFLENWYEKASPGLFAKKKPLRLSWTRNLDEFENRVHELKEIVSLCSREGTWKRNRNGWKLHCRAGRYLLLTSAICYKCLSGHLCSQHPNYWIPNSWAPSVHRAVHGTMRGGLKGLR